MTASEMQHFILNAPLVLGDLIPKNDGQLKLFVLLGKIVALALQYCIIEADSETMELLVKRHHKLYGTVIL